MEIINLCSIKIYILDNDINNLYINNLKDYIHFISNLKSLNLGRI